MSKTVLNQTKLNGRRMLSVVAAFTIAMSGVAGFACGSSDEEADFDIQDEQSLQDAQQLGDNIDSTLVQGRDKCIEAYKELNKSEQEAEHLCDQAEAEANNNSSTVIVENNEYYNNNGYNNALLWYMIGRNSGYPAVYVGSPSAGLNRVYVGTAPTPPPPKLNSSQTDYLKTPAPARPTTTKIGQSVNVSHPVDEHGNPVSHPSITTSHGGLGGGGGIGTSG